MTQGNRPMLGNRNRIMICCTSGLFAGCVLFRYLSSSWFLIPVAVFLIASGILLKKAGKKVTVSLFLLCLLFGFLRTTLAADRNIPDEGSYQIVATVSGFPVQKSETRSTMTLRNISLNGVPVSGKAYFSLRSDYLEEPLPELFDGAILSFTGHVYHPDESSGSVHFDFRQWMMLNGYSFGISTYNMPILMNDRASAPVSDLSSRIRKSLENQLKETMGESSSVAMAILFGERSELSEEDYSAFQTLGIAHVMSVSGLHIGILAGFLMKLLKRANVHRWARLPFLAFFLFGYSWLTGFSPASIRAAVMFLTLFTCKLLLRAPDRLTVLSLAALLILLVNPFQAASTGFVLSFSAMIGIYALSRPIVEWLDRLWPTWELMSGRHLKARLHNGYRHSQQSIKSGIAISVGAQAGVLLPTAACFNQIPLLGLLMNLLLVPFIGGILTPLLFVTSALSFLPLIGPAIAWASSQCVDALLWAVRLCSSLPGAVLRVPSPNALTVFGILLTVLPLTRLIPAHTRTRIISAAAAAVLTVAVTVLTFQPSLRFIQLSAGQADSALLTDGRETIVIDTGEDGRELIDYLLAENRRIDLLFLTHLHMDHCGGLPALLQEGISIGKIVLPFGAEEQEVDEKCLFILEEAKNAGIPIEYAAAGDLYSFSSSSLKVLWPIQNKVRAGANPNEYSMAMLLHFGEYRILLSADVGEDYETYYAVPADVLKVAHHGSSYASSNEFLSEVSPSYAIITCSENARLPSDDALERLSEHNIRVFRTDTGGDLLFTLKKGRLQITPSRKGAFP